MFKKVYTSHWIILLCNCQIWVRKSLIWFGLGVIRKNYFKNRHLLLMSWVYFKQPKRLPFEVNSIGCLTVFFLDWKFIPSRVHHCGLSPSHPIVPTLTGTPVMLVENTAELLFHLLRTKTCILFFTLCRLNFKICMYLFCNCNCRQNGRAYLHTEMQPSYAI